MPLALPPIVYVMGPSGAGKDSILRFARTNLKPSEKIAFAHRYITRPPEAAGENHIALTQAEFDLRQKSGLFAFEWRAHETSYGIGIEVHAWRRAGIMVVMNGSRRHFSTLDPASGDIVPILITAAPDILAARLSRRGRETDAAILTRLEREADVGDASNMRTIENSGSLETAGRNFVDVLRGLAYIPVQA